MQQLKEQQIEELIAETGPVETADNDKKKTLDLSTSEIRLSDVSCKIHLVK